MNKLSSNGLSKYFTIVVYYLQSVSHVPSQVISVTQTQGNVYVHPILEVTTVQSVLITTMDTIHAEVVRYDHV